jgi:hypothetical protein
MMLAKSSCTVLLVLTSYACASPMTFEDAASLETRVISGTKYIFSLQVQYQKIFLRLSSRKIPQVLHCDSSVFAAIVIVPEAVSYIPLTNAVVVTPIQR